MKRRVSSFLQLIYSVILSLLVLLLSGLPALAQEAVSQPNQTTSAVSSSQPGPADPKEFEAFIDKFFRKYQGKQIPGAVFVLVKDDNIFFSKGYGYANLEQKTPVIPDKTLFRIGSISKLITATAVMQLAEQGKLNLNEDINQYLKQFQVEKNNFKPITTAHLLTHTDGFDVAWTIGAATRCQLELPSLEQFLAKNLPPRVLQPGEQYVYGDAGIAVAGYLVEAISGVPFIQYMDKNILQPLKMQHSSFLQPLPPQLRTDLAVGYDSRNGTYIRTPFTCGKSVPTIGLSTTGTDMAHFMIAHLQGGRYGNTRILQENTVGEMHRQHFTNFPNTPQTAGSAYGFYERFQNDQRAIEHGGSLYGYSSQLFLMPEQKLGFFVAFNNDDKGNIRENLIKQFLDRYYPEKTRLDGHPSVQPSAEFQQLDQQINGSYRFIRYPHHSIVKLWIVWFGPRPNIRLKTRSDGTITFLPRGTEWVEVEPLLFRYRKSNIYMSFRHDAQQIKTMSVSNYVFLTYEKLAWYETATLQRLLLGVCLLVFLSAVFVWLGKFLIQRWRKQSSGVSRITRLVQLLGGLIGGVNLLFILGMLLVITQVNYWEFFFGMPPFMIALLYLPILSAGLTTGFPIVTLLAWRDKSWSAVGRLHSLLIMLAAGVFIFLLNYWNLLGFRF